MQPPVPRRAPPRTRKKPDPNVYRANTNLAAYPYLSLEERDARWVRVREVMDREKLDCIVVPPSSVADSTEQAATRYLTCVGGDGLAVTTVFPLVREPAAITTNAVIWSAAQPWCTDLREALPSHADAVLQKLSEISLRRRRVGVVGLGPDASASRVPAGFFDGLRGALPSITWIDFTPRLDALRNVKSWEEISFIGRAQQTVDEAFATAARALQPGVPARAVWADVVATLCREGSESPFRSRMAHERTPPTWHPSSADGSIEAGAATMLGLEASWGGYRTRGRQAMLPSAPNAAQKTLGAALADVWREALAALRPGRTLSEMSRRPFRRAKAASLECRIMISGCGLGGDGPMLDLERTTASVADQTLAPGNCFSLSIELSRGDSWMSWGDGVVITDRAAKRLGAREIDPWTSGSPQPASGAVEPAVTI